MTRIVFPAQPLTPSLLRTPEAGRSAAAKAGGAVTGSSFQEVLQGQLADIRFSQHAQQRLAQRGIKLSADQQERLQSAVRQAAGKGGKEALVLVDSLAFVVSVRNRTVITALEGDGVKSQVFTNIDSAVIV